MKKAGIFYGSTTGTTETVAKQIAVLLDINDADIFNVADANVDSTDAYEVLLLGTPTWGYGDLQEDWESFLDQLKNKDLMNKTVALFGCGDASAYDSSFCDAIGILYEGLQNSGCKFCGNCPTDDYNFSESKAVVDGQFVGLAIDAGETPNQTDERINKWVTRFKSECLM